MNQAPRITLSKFESGKNQEFVIRLFLPCQSFEHHIKGEHIP